MTRLAKINDLWRNSSKFHGYRLYIKKLIIENISIFDDFEVSIDSTLTSICGKNGIGKTSLLKLIHKILTKDENLNLGAINEAEIQDVKIVINNNNVESTVIANDNTIISKVEYFDISAFSYETNDLLKEDIHQSGLINYATERYYDIEEISILNKITSKTYSKIKLYEISGAHDNGKTYPYFEVTIDNRTYSSNNMGTGEHKIFILIWKMLNLEKHSILLLEEPESFLCPSSQIKLLDFVIEIIDKNKINLILSTHSEHILSKQPIHSIKLLKKTNRNKHQLLSASDNIKYLTALGLQPSKQNIYLVEDQFAKLMLEIILKEIAQDLYLISYIHNLSCESDIQMLSKHYKNYPGINIFAVYDADQSSLIESFSPHIPKLFLPSNKNYSPEEEIINSLLANLSEYSQMLNVEEGYLSATIENNQNDHHDFFIELGRDNELPEMNELKMKAIKLWISQNKELVEKFIFELRNITKTIEIELLPQNIEEAYRIGKIKPDNIVYKLDHNQNGYQAGDYRAKLIHSPKDKCFIVKIAD